MNREGLMWLVEKRDIGYDSVLLQSLVHIYS
jgi:hypothetical protein